MGSRRMNEVWSAMYSPADLPSRWRAAPAKKRTWSTRGGISSARVTATGLPVLADSTRTRSRGRGLRGVGDADEGRARVRGSGVPPLGEGGGGGRHGRIDVLGPRDRGL